MESSEYDLIQRAREQNRERKRIQKELQSLKSRESENSDNDQEMIISEQDHAKHQFDDYRGLGNIAQRKAKLEQREQELMVHTPHVLNTTMQTFGSKLHKARPQFIDQQQLYFRKKKLRAVIIFLNSALLFGK